MLHQFYLITNEEDIMKTITQAPTAEVGSTIKVVAGNVWDTNGAAILEAVVVGEVIRECVGRQLLCIHDKGFMYMVTELKNHPGFHYCTSAFNFDERWHGHIAEMASVTKAQVREWAETNLSNLNRIESIVDEDVLDKYMEMVGDFNGEEKPLEGEDYDI